MQQNKFNKMTDMQNAKFDTKFIQIGIVKDNRDPQKMGRLKVWIEGSQSNKTTKESWITCNYASPFAGRTQGTAGADNYVEHPKSYGFWAVPPDVETRVMVFFVNGQIERAFWFSATYDYAMNGMVPGTHTQVLPKSDLDTPLPITEYDRNSASASEDAPNINVPLTNSLKTQNLLYDAQRGVPNRSARRQAPANVYGLSSPRGNHICLDDGWKPEELSSKTWDDDQTGYQDTENNNPVNDTVTGSREDEGIVLKTRSGAQILISESKGNIFIINRDGTSRIEMDADGHVTMHAHKSVSIRAKEDLNFIAERDINLEAGRNMITSINGFSRTEVSGKFSVLGHDAIVLNSDTTIDIKATSELRLQGASSYIVGDDALAISSPVLTLDSPAMTLASSALLLDSASIALKGPVVVAGALSATTIIDGSGIGLGTHTHIIDGWVNAGNHAQTVAAGVDSATVPSTPAAPDLAPDSSEPAGAEPVEEITQTDVIEVDGDALVNTSIAKDINITPSKSLSSSGLVMPTSGRVSEYGYWGVGVAAPTGETKTKTGWDIETSDAIIASGDGKVKTIDNTSISIAHSNGYVTLYKNIEVDTTALQVNDDIKTGRVIGQATTIMLFEIRKSGAPVIGFSGTMDPGLFFFEDTGVGSDAAGAKLISGKNTNPYQSSNVTVESGSTLVHYADYSSIASLFPKSGSIYSPIAKPNNSATPVESPKPPQVKVEENVVSKAPINWVVENTDELVLSDLMHFEGSVEYQTNRKYYRDYKFWLYIDTRGYATIGYGHLITSGEDFNNGITNDEADSILKQDISIAVRDAQKIANSYNMIIPYDAQVVLTEMAFQLGYSGLANFTEFLRALANHQYAIASAEMQDSLWYNQTPERAKTLAARIRSLG